MSDVSILELDQQELVVTNEDWARAVAIVEGIEFLSFNCFDQIVDYNRSLRHDSSRGLCCREVSCISDGEDVLVLVVSECPLVHINEAICRGYGL